MAASEGDDGSDKRSHQRVRAVKLLQYKHFDPEHLAEQLIDDLGLGKTLDLSEGGLKFVCNTALPTSWGLHLDLALEGDEILSVEGRIVYCEEVAEGRYRIGVRFTDMTEAARLKLDALVKDRARRKVSLA